MTTAAAKLCSKGCGTPSRKRGMCANHYEQHRVRQQAYGRWVPRIVDAEPARIHIKNLRAAGLGMRRISELSGVSQKSLQWIVNGRRQRGTGPSGHIRDTTAAAILAVPVPEIPHRVAADYQLVPAVGTCRRLRALMAIGYCRRDLCARIGVHPSNGWRLFHDHQEMVLAVTARRVERIFNDLQLTPGPSVRARNEARRRGWPPPLAWDEEDIDYPAAEPDRGADTEVGFVERYTELRELGYNDREIAERMGIKLDSVERQLFRYNMFTPCGGRQ